MSENLEPEAEDQDFVAPRTGEQAEVPAEEPEEEKQEVLTERFVESPEMFDLRQKAFNDIEDRRQMSDGTNAAFPLMRDPFLETYLNPYLALGQEALETVAPEAREVAELELAVYAAQFQGDCGFWNNGQASLKLLVFKFEREKREDLIDKLYALNDEIDQGWVKPTRAEAEIPQEQIDQFLQGVSIRSLDISETVHGQVVDCNLSKEVSLLDFRRMVQRAILPQLTGNDTVWVRGDSLPPEYLKALATEMLKTDFPVVATFDSSRGQYCITYSEGNEEPGSFIPDPENQPDTKG